MKSLNESTMISVGVVIGIMCGVVYVSSVAFQSQANAQSIRDLQEQMQSIEEMKTDVAVIKNEVQTIKKLLKEGD